MKKSQLTRGRPRTFDEAKILKKAMQLFWENGYETTSMGELSKELGLTAPSIYAAFGNKEELFDKCVGLYKEKYSLDLNQIFKETKSAKEAISKCLITLAHSYTESEQAGCMIISSATNCTKESKKIQAKLREMRKLSEALIESKIVEAKKNKELPSSVNPGNLAKFYAATIQGMSLQAQDGSSTDELLAIVKLAMSAWPK